MQKLIPTIYFYVLSAVGMVLFIIGLFNSVHYVVGVTSYDKYPLRYGAESRCDYMPRAIPVEGTKGTEETRETEDAKEDCLKSVEKERETTKADDLEKSLAFTIIGFLVFSTHFYFARKQRTS